MHVRAQLQAGRTLRRDWISSHLSPLQKGFLFLGSFISPLCLLLVQFKIRKLKFMALLISWDFNCDLSLCKFDNYFVYFKFLLSIDNESKGRALCSVLITNDIIALVRFIGAIFFRPYWIINLSKQSREEVSDAKHSPRSFSTKNYMFVSIFMMIGETVSKSINEQQTNRYTNIHLYT